MKETEAKLNKILDRKGDSWGPTFRRLARSRKFRAALIVRNVKYRNWGVRDVEMELKTWEDIPPKRRLR
jgi:hypothetical protein